MEVAEQIVSRAILMRGLLEVWGEGANYEECVAAAESFPADRKAAFQDKTFKINVSAFGRTIGQSEALERINRFMGVGLRGKVRLKKPQVVFWILED